MNDLQIILIVIGLVALARGWMPWLDGAMVAVTAVVLATTTACLAGTKDFADSVCRGVVCGLMAFGAMAAIRYAARKFVERRERARAERVAKDASDDDDDGDGPPTLPTAAAPCKG